MKYSDDYMYSKDIDWFCVINDIYYIHIASAGGILPEPINDRDKLRRIQKQVFDLPHIFTDDEILINETFIHERFHNSIEEGRNYLHSFINMSKKGFISMDRTNLFDLDDQTYHIVCMPIQLNSLKKIDDFFKIENGDIYFDKPISNINMLEIF